MSASRHSSSSCNSFLSFICSIDILKNSSFCSHIFHLNCFIFCLLFALSIYFTFLHPVVDLPLCISPRFLMEFSFVILKCSALFLVVDTVLLTLFYHYFHKYLIYSFQLFCQILLWFIFWHFPLIVSLSIFLSLVYPLFFFLSFLICFSSLISHSGFVFLFLVL